MSSKKGTSTLPETNSKSSEIRPFQKEISSSKHSFSQVMLVSTGYVNFMLFVPCHRLILAEWFFPTHG